MKNHQLISVIPAKAGIQTFKNMDSCFRRNDKGVSLVEMMMSLFISAVLFSLLTSYFIASHRMLKTMIGYHEVMENSLLLSRFFKINFSEVEINNLKIENNGQYGNRISFDRLKSHKIFLVHKNVNSLESGLFFLDSAGQMTEWIRGIDYLKIGIWLKQSGNLILRQNHFDEFDLKNGNGLRIDVRLHSNNIIEDVSYDVAFN